MSPSSQTLILLTILACPYKSINTYRKEVGPNGEDIWLSTSNFIPIQSQSYGSIKLGQVMSTEFDFIWAGRTNYPLMNVYENFFRVGYDATINRNCEGEGARYPSFWLTNNEDTLHVSASSGTICQPTQSLKDYGPINISISYHIKISFNNTQLLVEISGGDRANWSKTWNRQPTSPQYIGETVPIWWMSNKYSDTLYNAARGFFSNVIIKSAIFSSTFNPTTASSTMYTMNPSLSPPIIPTSTALSAKHLTQISSTFYSLSNPIYSEETRTVRYVTGSVYAAYFDSKSNMVLLSVTVVTCTIGICLVHSVMKKRKELREYSDNEAVRVPPFGDGNWDVEGEREDTDHDGNVGEDKVDDLEKKEEGNDDDGDIISTITKTVDTADENVMQQTVLAIFDTMQRTDDHGEDIIDIISQTTDREIYGAVVTLIDTAHNVHGDVQSYYD